jgi:hypothetical protein
MMKIVIFMEDNKKQDMIQHESQGTAALASNGVNAPIGNSDPTLKIILAENDEM